MKPNKSIDGLITRDAKNSASILSSPKIAKKSVATHTPNHVERPKAFSKTSKTDLLEDAILENSLEIEVKDDFDFKQPAEKTAKSQKSPEPQKLEKPQKPKESAKTERPEIAINDFLSEVEPLNLEDEDPKNKDHRNKTKKADKKKPKKTHKVRRIILIVVFILLLCIGGFVTWAVFYGNDFIAKITGGQGNVLDLLTFAEETYEPLKTDPNGRTNILAFGTSGYNMEGDEGNGIHAGAQLTDSIMMISLNQETGDIAMTSLPRDLKASPTCTATGKINEVYWCNGGGGDATTEQESIAAAALMAEVGSILGVEFQYYAHLNWGSLVQIVDALDGITITLDEDILDYYWTGAVFEAGKEYTINGEQALGLARARHGTTGGDFSRGNSQQKILIGIKNRIFEKNLSITDLLNLASALNGNLRTSFSLPEIKTLAHLTYLFDLESMRQIALYDSTGQNNYMTTGTIDGISYVFPLAGVGNYSAIKAHIAESLSNDPRVYEKASIIVLNSTEEVGVAATLRDQLIEEGFNIAEIGNADLATPLDSVYNIYALNDEIPGTIDLLEKYFSTTSFSAAELPENVTHDYDIVIIIGGNQAQE